MTSLRRWRVTLGAAAWLCGAAASAQTSPMEVRCEPAGAAAPGVADQVSVAAMRVPATRAQLRVTVTCVGVAPPLPPPPPAAWGRVLLGVGVTSFVAGLIAATFGAKEVSSRSPVPCDATTGCVPPAAAMDHTAGTAVMVGGTALILAGVGMTIVGLVSSPPAAPRVRAWVAPETAGVVAGVGASF